MKISLSNLLNYFSVALDSKQKRNVPQKSGTLTTTGGGGVGHFVVGTTQKYHFFDAAPKRYLVFFKYFNEYVCSCSQSALGHMED